MLLAQVIPITRPLLIFALTHSTENSKSAPCTLSTIAYRSVELSRADTAEVTLCLIDGSSTSMARRTFSFPNDGRATSRQNTRAANALTMLIMRASHGQD